MPKIICKVCNGTKDANYDLPSDEYIHYPCQSCKNGIENFCSACDGEGTYWTYGSYGDCGCMHYCDSCNGTGHKLDSISFEEECSCVKREPALIQKQEEQKVFLMDYFDQLLLEKGECLYCNGTKKVTRTVYEGEHEYNKRKEMQ